MFSHPGSDPDLAWVYRTIDVVLNGGTRGPQILGQRIFSCPIISYYTDSITYIAQNTMNSPLEDSETRTIRNRGIAGALGRALISHTTNRFVGQVRHFSGSFRDPKTGLTFI